MRKSAVVVMMVAALAGMVAGCTPEPQAPPAEPPSTTEPALPTGTEPIAPSEEESQPAGGTTDTAPGAGQVTIYRDTWGVPHIYAATDADAVFGLGYAQAEDRLGDIYANIRTATGTASEAFGEENVQVDFAMQLVKNSEVSANHYEKASPELRTLADSFVAGINEYVTRHPEKKPEWALEIQPWHSTAIGRAMIMRWPLGTIQDDLKNRKKRADHPAGASNEWAIAPKRSATGGAILLTDPHLGWEGMQVFYEARVHGDKLHMNGFFVVGSPLLGFGHTQHVGWAPTTGGPDTSDVFEVKLDMSNFMKPKYEIDGQWREITPRQMKVTVKGGEVKMQPGLDTELGPIFNVDQEAGIAYVGASPYFSQAGLIDQTYQMLLAKNSDEFHAALGMNQLMEQNIMFADTAGNIQYVRTGRVPVRNKELDWNAPVPATAAAIWKEIHPIDDLVQIKNPEHGYMQNCNISPQNMMKNSPMTPDKYLNYIYNVSWDFNNPRSKRAVELLDADDSVTKEEAMAIALNVYDILAKPWQEALASAVDSIGADRMKDETFAKTVKAILDWNGEFVPEATATPVYKVWRQKCNEGVNLEAIANRTTLTPEEKTLLLDRLAESIAEMKTKYNAVEVPWGDLYRVGRSGQYFPVGGADFNGSTDGINMTETLFDVRSKDDKDAPGKYVANNGSMATMLMFFHEDGIESYTVIPWGQSGDPASAHHVDQGRELYSKRQFKSTWWKKDELLANVESELTLEIP